MLLSNEFIHILGVSQLGDDFTLFMFFVKA